MTTTGWNRRAATWWLTLALLAAAGPGRGQEAMTIRIPGGPQGAEVKVEETSEEPAERLPEPLIGLDAYEEVLHSGEYLVGPGDRFHIQMPDAEKPVEVRVLAEGGLFIPRTGRIQVGARRLREVRAAIDSAFAASFLLTW